MRNHPSVFIPISDVWAFEVSRDDEMFEIKLSELKCDEEEEANTISCGLELNDLVQLEEALAFIRRYSNFHERS